MHNILLNLAKTLIFCSVVVHISIIGLLKMSIRTEILEKADIRDWLDKKNMRYVGEYQNKVKHKLAFAKIMSILASAS
jgi:hypothetical protein